MKQILKWIPWILVSLLLVTTATLFQKNHTNKSKLYNLQIEILFEQNASVVRALENNDLLLLEEVNRRIKSLDFTESSDLENLRLVVMLYESSVKEVIDGGLEGNDIILDYFAEIGDKIIEAKSDGLNNSTDIDRFLQEIINDLDELKEEVIPSI